MTDLTFVDTDVLIDAGRGISVAIACLQQIEQESSMAISAVVQMELITGCHNRRELRAVEQFLSRFRLVKLNEKNPI